MILCNVWSAYRFQNPGITAGRPKRILKIAVDLFQGVVFTSWQDLPCCMGIPLVGFIGHDGAEIKKGCPRG